MNAAALNEVLEAGGVSGGWQALVMRLALAAAKVLAPAAVKLLERAVTVGGAALAKRLEQAMAPEETPDYALRIVEGIERDHGPGAPLANQWPGDQRAAWARDDIEQWLRDSGANPDAALLNEIVENAVGRLKVKQAAAADAAKRRG